MGGIEVLPFGMLIFVVGALLVANLWGVVDAKMATDSAAREAVRAYVEAPDARVGAARATDAARATMVGHGRHTDGLVVVLRHEGGLPFARCVRATVEIDYPVPALDLPWIGGLGHAFDVRSSHTERIDPFRSGLNGVGTC